MYVLLLLSASSQPWWLRRARHGRGRACSFMIEGLVLTKLQQYDFQAVADGEYGVHKFWGVIAGVGLWIVGRCLCG